MIPEIKANRYERLYNELWEEHNGGKINISSKKQMGEIVFNYMKVKPLTKTTKKKVLL